MDEQDAVVPGAEVRRAAQGAVEHLGRVLQRGPRLVERGVALVAGLRGGGADGPDGGHRDQDPEEEGSHRSSRFHGRAP